MEKSSRWWDLPSAALLLLATLFSAWRLQTTDWTEGLGHVRTVALLGLLLGLALGQSHFQRRGIVLLSTGYMLAFFTWQWLGFIEFTRDQSYLGDQLWILSGRLFTDLGEFFSGRPVQDQLLVMALLCIPYWFASLYSGFQLTRHANFLASILPSGILMLLVYMYHYTTRDYTWMFGAYVFVALLLLGRQKFLADRTKWMKERVQLSSESGVDITNATFIMAVFLVALAWSIPYTLSSTADAKEFWQKTTGDWFNGDRFDNLFSSVHKEKKPLPRNFRTQMALGTQISQSELVVFLVYVPSNVDEIPRLYWRGQVFDTFENDSWLTTSQNEIRHTSTDGDLDVPDTAHRRRFSFTYDVYAEGQTILYSASQPIWLNHNAIVLNSPLAENDDTLDVMALRPSPALEAGDLYRMSAMIADPTIPELQEAGSAYPDWVKEKYLQLPADFSPRIRALARQVTAQSTTPYEKAQAVTDYLRSNIEYRSGISFPSADVDQLEYFLFERKQGFCNYYASAEVLMLRSSGIPARLAVGYAQGEPNLQGSIYTVREKDLHAWPEVYFPGYGWIEFEPTGNQTPLTRPLERKEASPLPTPQVNPIREIPQEETEAPTLPPNVAVERAALTPGQARGIAFFGGGLLIALVGVFLKRRLAPNTPLAGLLKSALDRGGVTSPSWLDRWVIWASLTPIERHFHSINTGLRWMGHPQPVYSTAAERARILSKLIPDAAQEIAALLEEHQSAMFSPRDGDEAAARKSAQMILYKTMSVRLKIFILGYN